MIKMERIVLSSRLQAIVDYIAPYRRIADIGTDHCYVPIYLAQNGFIDFAVATDLRDGPVQEARKNVARFGVHHCVHVRKGDGLTPLRESDGIEVVIIAGMGGRLIQKLLEQDAKRLTTVKRYILQPNKSAWLIREWLFTNSYTITDEKMLSDGGIIYEIIVAEPSSKPTFYTKEDILFGPILRKRREETFLAFWENELHHKENIISRIPPNHPQRKRLEEEIQTIIIELSGQE